MFRALTPDDDLLAYRLQIEQFPKIASSEEERELIRLWQQHGDESARNKVVEAHLRYAFSMALRYRRTGAPLCDLVSEANLGLFKALNDFDLSEPLYIRFYKEAESGCRTFIRKYIVENWHQVKLPERATGFLFALRREFAASGTNAISLKRVAEMGEQKKFSREEAIQLYNSFIRRDPPYAETAADVGPLLDIENLADGAGSVEDSLIAQMESEARVEDLRRALTTLTEMEYTIFMRRRLAETPAHTTELARELKCSDVTIGNIQRRAEQKVIAAMLGTNSNFTVKLEPLYAGRRGGHGKGGNFSKGEGRIGGKVTNQELNMAHWTAQDYPALEAGE